MRARLLVIAAATTLPSEAAFAQAEQSAAVASLLIAVFIALIAALLIALTITVRQLSTRVAECCRKSDALIRGYMFPVGPTLYREGSSPDTLILSRAGNFGRTPCILKESYLEAVTSEPGGTQAVYQNGRLLQHDLVIDANAHDVSLPVPAFSLGSTTPVFLVGYFRYLDVFGASHMTRYCYRIGPGVHRAGSAAWNAFD